MRWGLGGAEKRPWEGPALGPVWVLAPAAALDTALRPREAVCLSQGPSQGLLIPGSTCFVRPWLTWNGGLKQGQKSPSVKERGL